MPGPRHNSNTVSGIVYKLFCSKWWPGHAIAQADSLRLPTAAALIRSRVRSCGFCGGQSFTGARFLRVLRFPLPIHIPPTAPHSSSTIRGWYNRPISDRSIKCTHCHPTRKIIIKIIIGQGWICAYRFYCT
jgi:hypothetical protein